METLRLMKERDRYYCHSCNLLTTKTEIEEHRNHVITAGISDTLLKQPSKLLSARNNNKSQAVSQQIK